MITKCKNGNIVDRWYDRLTKSFVTAVKDCQGNQVGDADYSGNKQCAAYAKAKMIKDNEGTA